MHEIYILNTIYMLYAIEMYYILSLGFYMYQFVILSYERNNICISKILEID